MSDTTHISETVSAGQLRAFIERIERIEEEIKTANSDKSEVYKEARGCGFDVKAIRQCVADRKLDSAEREERTAIFELYWSALTGSVHVHAPARENIEEFPPHDTETGEITEHEQPETATQSQGVQEARSMPAESMGDEISEREGLAGPACAHDDETANTKPAPNSHSAEIPPAADKPETAVTPLPVVSGAIPEGIPAFLLKERKPLRPNCLHPENCAGYGSHTCHSCTRAMTDSEAAA